MDQQRLTYLLAKYHSDEATAAETEELSAFLQDDTGQTLFNEVVAGEIEHYSGKLSPEQDTRFADLAQKALRIDKVPVPAGRVAHTWIWAAASVLILVAAGAIWWKQVQKPVQDYGMVQKPAAITPGKPGAVLTLADCSEIVLDSMGNGIIARQAGAQVVLANGGLSYNKSSADVAALTYNTMSTPKGRQFRITLPDGTKAWLNAASSLRFPVSFAKDKRLVEVQGEVYFEVAANADAPFQVQVGNNATVDVLGTHFNIHAYDNEPTINTTLLEGRIKISAGAAASVLQPGQQAQVGRDKPAITVNNNADTEQVMAWKNGLFNFEGATLQEVMRQLERWYDIEVRYEGKPPAISFAGEMEMGMPLNDLLSMLSEMNVHFRMESGRMLVVTP